MITRASLKNFKSWREVRDMRLAPITGLFGTNSSGKTSILQWLLMLKQTSESSDRVQPLNLGDERSLVELGTFRDLVYGHQEPGALAWELTWTLPGPLRIPDPQGKPGSILFQDKTLTLASDLVGDSKRGGRIQVRRFSYRFAGQEFGLESIPSKPAYKLSAKGTNGFKLKRAPGRAWDLPPPVKCYGFPDQVFNYYQNAGFLANFQLALEQLLAGVFYLGPLREYPRRQYTWGGAQPADMGRRGEKVIDAILSSRQRGEKISRGKGKPKLAVEEYAAYWLHELGLIDRFEVKAVAEGSNIYQVLVHKTQGSPPVLITDVGFGISQILPVIVLCYYAPEGATVILEQPEIHLHPSVQAGLADVLIDAMRVRKIQVIVESHSEHLLRRLQRRIAEEQIATDDVALYFCDYGYEASRLVPLEVDMFGSIVNWPKDFFGNEFEEMADTTRAAMRRRLALKA
jgi:hypothetical protein